MHRLLCADLRHACVEYSHLLHVVQYVVLNTIYMSCSAAQEWSKIKEEELQIQTRQKAILQRDKSRRTRILKKICLQFQDIVPIRRARTCILKFQHPLH